MQIMEAKLLLICKKQTSALVKKKKKKRLMVFIAAKVSYAQKRQGLFGLQEAQQVYLCSTIHV